MKTARKFNTAEGSALLITLVITGILTLALAGYLSMISGQYRLTMRSQEWNGTIPITEAGIEEALAHLNMNCMTNGINVNPFNPTADGWAHIGSDKYQKTKTLADGSYFTATIDISVLEKPKIDSAGYIPALTAGLKPGALFAAVGVESENNETSDATENNANAAYLKRDVLVTARIIPVFTHALAADKGIDLNGHNVATDSFNSTNGPYNPSSRNDNGDVATNSDVQNDLNIGNANIRGVLSIAPGGEKEDIAIGPNGVAGSNEYVDGGNTGIQEGHWNDDMNVEFEAVEAPFESGNQSVYSPYTFNVISNIVITNIISTCSGYTCIPDGEGGTVSPITQQTTSATYPSYGTYVGTVLTNWTAQSSSSYPSGTFRDVTTNTVATVSDPYDYPEDGVYAGSVSSNIVNVRSRSEPGEGAFEPGSLYKQGAWYYYKVKVYHYQKITGYSYQKVTSYTYAAITGNQRAVLTTQSVTNSVDFDYAFINDGNYKVPSLSGKILVAAHATVYCTGGFTADMLYIAPSGASLKLYVGGDVDIKGNQKVNEGGYAKNMSLYGLPTCENISVSGNGEFTGTIYAPSAHLQLNGGGSDTKDFFGAAIAKSAQLNGHVNFHYDEDLLNSGPSRGYIANSWREN